MPSETIGASTTTETPAGIKEHSEMEVNVIKEEELEDKTILSIEKDETDYETLYSNRYDSDLNPAVIK